MIWAIILTGFLFFPGFIAILNNHKHVGSVITLNIALVPAYYLVYSVTYALDLSYFVMMTIDTLLFLCLLAWAFANSKRAVVTEVDIEL